MEVAITSVKDIIAKNVVKYEAIISLKFLTMQKLNILANSMGEQIKKWNVENSVPLVWEFNQNTAQKIFKDAAKVHYIYFQENKDNFAWVKEAVESTTVD